MVKRVSDLFAIRTAHKHELSQLPDIERAAGQLFRTIGMGDIADHEPTLLGDLEKACAEGLLWVGAFGDRLAGFALANLVDGNLHLDEIAVDPDFSRRGLGTALVETVCDDGGARSCPWVTLRTFVDVPWNAPFYLRLGFSEIPNADLTPSLNALVSGEADRGLYPNRRVFMRRWP